MSVADEQEQLRRSLKARLAGRINDAFTRVCFDVLIVQKGAVLIPDSPLDRAVEAKPTTKHYAVWQTQCQSAALWWVEPSQKMILYSDVAMADKFCHI